MNSEELKNKLRQEARTFKSKMDVEAMKAKAWIDRNKFFIGVAAGPALALTRELVISKRKSDERKAEMEKLKRVYDPSTGVYYRLKHPMTKDEIAALNAWKGLGASEASFFENYNLLK